MLSLCKRRLHLKQTYTKHQANQTLRRATHTHSPRMPFYHGDVWYIKTLLAYLCILRQLEVTAFVATSEFALKIYTTQWEIPYMLLNIFFFFHFLYHIISLPIFHIHLRPELFLAQTLKLLPQYISFSGFNSLVVVSILLQSKYFLCLEREWISFAITFIVITLGMIVFRFLEFVLYSY